MANTKVHKECFDLVAAYFKYRDKPLQSAYIWFNAKNPSLGGITPLDMIKNGRGKKLLRFIKSRLEENKI